MTQAESKPNILSSLPFPSLSPNKLTEFPKVGDAVGWQKGE
jgi:hypothetical protein